MTNDVFTNHYRPGEHNSENSIYFYYCRIELTSHKNKAETTATPWSSPVWILQPVALQKGGCGLNTVKEGSEHKRKVNF